MRSVLSPPIDEFFSAEFPCDNPEIWRVRPPPASFDLLAPAPSPVVEVASVDAAEDTALQAPEVQVPEVQVVQALDLAGAEPIEDDTVDVVIDDFSDDDFAHATLESVIPPPMASAAAPPMPEVSSEPAPPAPDFFAVYLQTLRDVALTAGARADLVEALPGMLGLERLDVRDLDDATVDALVTARLLARGDAGQAVRDGGLVRTAQAWRSAIAGEEPDFSACGTEMLDEWSATVVSGLLGAPARKEPLRRQLRSRGVAAFGLLIEAA